MGQVNDRHFVMVVDDDQDIREAITDTLREYGYQVLTFSDGAEAVDYLSGGGPKPLLIFLDLMMPKKTGWEVLRDLESSGLLDYTTVKVLTATGTKMQGVGILKKPFRAQDLVDIVEAVFQ